MLKRREGVPGRPNLRHFIWDKVGPENRAVESTKSREEASGLRQRMLWAQPSAFLSLGSAFEYEENQSFILALRLVW